MVTFVCLFSGLIERVRGRCVDVCVRETDRGVCVCVCTMAKLSLPPAAFGGGAPGFGGVAPGGASFGFSSTSKPSGGSLSAGTHTHTYTSTRTLRHTHTRRRTVWGKLTPGAFLQVACRDLHIVYEY